MKATGCEKAKELRRPMAARAASKKQKQKRTREMPELEAQLEEMQFELDVASATLDAVLKKCEGGEQDPAESSRQRQRLLTSLKDKRSQRADGLVPAGSLSLAA